MGVIPGLLKGYGKASLELDAPATASTLYGLGSISKQFTATAIMLLVEERKIGLDDRVTNYFGWLPKEWGEITVRHLLTQNPRARRGLARFFDVHLEIHR